MKMIAMGLLCVSMAFGGLGAAAAIDSSIKVLNEDAHYPEGPIWHDGKLYYVEYDRNTVTVWDGKTNRVFAEQKGCGQSAVIPTTHGEFLTTCYDNGTIGRMAADGAQMTPYSKDSEGHPFKGPNDFAPDARGGIYFTASGDVSRAAVTDGEVFYIAADGVITQVLKDLHNANGIAVSKDGKILYVVETSENRVLQFDITNPLYLSNRRLFVNLDTLTHRVVHIWPDGIKIDSNGDIYIGQSARETNVPLAGTIFVVNSQGKMLRTLVLPSLQVPNFAFSPDENTLYVTGVDQIDKSPFHGKVYAIPNLRKIGGD